MSSYEYQNIFPFNVSNSRKLKASGLQLTSSPTNGAFLVSDEYGNSSWSTDINLSLINGVNVSTINFLRGVELDEINLGKTYLDNNNFEESDKLNSLLNDVANELTNLEINDKQIIVNVETNKGYFYFNDFVSVPKNISLHFKNPVVIGKEFSLDLSGSLQYEVDLEDSSIITAVNSSTSIDINNPDGALDWTAGDLISVRDESQDEREDLIISTFTDNGSNNYTITFTSATSLSLVPTDTCRKLQQSRLSTSASRHHTRLTLTDIDAISAGDTIIIKDSRKLGSYTGLSTDINNGSSNLWYSDNDFKFELNKVFRKITSSNEIILNSPLSNDFDSNYTYILRLNPLRDQFIKGLNAIQIEEPETRQNNHIIHLQRCFNCKVIDCSFSDKMKDITITTYPTNENFIRLRESFRCNIENCNYERYTREYAGSGSSYGITIYYSTNCTVNNCKLSTLRHNILLQGCNRCSFDNIFINNPLISGFDMHGLNERDNKVNNVFIDVSGNGALDSGVSQNSTVAGIRIGNSLHGQGSSFNEFDNIIIKIGLIADTTNISAIYGIELVPQSNNNIFRNCSISSSINQLSGRKMYGLYIADHPKYRLLETLNNKIINCTFDGIDNAVYINTLLEYSNSSHYESGSFSQNATNTTNLILPTTLTNYQYDKVYGGSSVYVNGTSTDFNWTLTITSGVNTGTYTITNYSSSTRTATITPALTNTTINADTFTLSSPARTLTPTNKNLKFIDNKLINCGIFVYSNYTENLLISNNYYDTATATTQRSVAKFENATSPKFIKNSTFNCYRGVFLAGSSNAVITDNNYISGQESITYETSGTNSNIIYKNNTSSGFNSTTSITGTDTYTYQREYLGFNTNPSSQSLIINQTNGRVGIGTTSPRQELDIVGDVLCSRLAVNTETFTKNGVDYKLAIDGKIYASQLDLFDFDTYNPFAPLNPFKLSSISTPESGIDDQLYINYTDSAGGITNNLNTAIYNGKNEIILFCDAANKRVGIGTTAPDEKLHIHGGDILIHSGGDNNVGLRFNQSSQGIYGDLSISSVGTTGQLIYDRGINYGNNGGVVNLAYIGGFSRIDTRSTQPLFSWWSQAVTTGTQTTRMCILEGGNVGIGTTNPSSKLHVVGDLNVTGKYFINGVDTLNSTSLGSTVVTSSLTSVGTLNSLNVSGNVGIGTTTPSALLHAYTATANTGALIGGTFVGNAQDINNAKFVHSNFQATSYAINSNNSGDTHLNAESGRAMYLRIANGDKMILTGSYTKFGSNNGATDANMIVRYYDPHLKFHSNSGGSNQIARISALLTTGDSGYNSCIRFYRDGADRHHIQLCDGTDAAMLDCNFPLGYAQINGGLIGTGNLTIDTDTLKVDATTDFVGLGKSTPATHLEINKTSPEIRLTDSRSNYGGIAGVDLGKISFYSDDISAPAYSPTAQIACVSSNANVFPCGQLNFLTGLNGVLSNQMTIWPGNAVDVINNLNVGTNALCVDSANKWIGIGTATPAYPIDIRSSAYSITNIHLTNSTSGSGSADGMIISQEGTLTKIVNMENDDLNLGCNNTDRLKLDASSGGSFIHFATQPTTTTPSAFFSKSVADATTNAWIGFYRGGTSVSALGTNEGYVGLSAGNLAFVNPSDASLKENIRDYTDGYDILKQLKARKFDWKDEYKPKDSVGFIADEVEGVLPRSVSVMETGYKGMSNTELIPTLWSACRTLLERLERLENKGRSPL